ncbi:beta-ketoacyl-[acyl-carrier-protein] synthase family protein [Streptomyces sp. CB01580]|uniref:beta-ketoacyl-[acyl-carrier-protein] synthase family protein n=1 Tax=Streptomyces sp. CB01580 TaxID=1703933 RepID=UPI00093C26DB|nr:beta-ketoacyl-[acyl-carrier-protein] synthase family protein [Streptomyces sp. CB01580]OKJ32484.1 3-oxoacyl-ACP synthase [Streptomyces sp. CB01580]
MTDPVAVTGVGAVTPLGVGADVLVSRLVAGESGLVDGDGRCADFDAGDFLTRRESRRNARFARLALVAAGEALGRAGWSEGLPYPADEIMCVVGTGLGGVPESPRAADATPLTVPLMMANAAAASLSRRYGLRGESYATAGACAAGAQAIGAALGAIRRGEVAAAVVGGAEAASVPLVRESFAHAGALSPTGRCVPFDADRDGFVMGEGAGILVLESLDGARARGAGILGLVRGYGASSDAHHLTAPSPDGIPAARAVRRALADAGVAAEDLSYINAHGTGTPLNDEAEIRALRLALGDALESVPLSSTKAATGHLFGAGGAVEAIVTLAALRDGLAPPTHGLARPDERLGTLDHVRTARPLAPGPGGALGLSDSLGFGGHNAVLVLGAP